MFTPTIQSKELKKKVFGVLEPCQHRVILKKEKYMIENCSQTEIRYHYETSFRRWIMLWVNVFISFMECGINFVECGIGFEIVKCLSQMRVRAKAVICLIYFLN